jgi:NAD(P)-dependent dehydrogenase (short-subunit alcohol dehydrogenase family)
MRKELLIFGSNGALGSGVTNLLSKKDFDRIYLFDFEFKNEASENKVEQIEIDDLSIEENVIQAFSKINTSNETLFFLFSTIGGFFGGKTVWNTEEKDFDKMININLKANFLISKHFGKLVSKAAGGSICLTSAYVASYQESEKAIYGASKAAVSHLVKTISEEGINMNMTANGIAPFIIDTPANRKFMKDADYNKWMKPEEIGELVWALFKNYNFISGNIIELKHRFNK